MNVRTRRRRLITLRAVHDRAGDNHFPSESPGNSRFAMILFSVCRRRPSRLRSRREYTRILVADEAAVLRGQHRSAGWPVPATLEALFPVWQTPTPGISRADSQRRTFHHAFGDFTFPVASRLGHLVQDSRQSWSAPPRTAWLLPGEGAGERPVHSCRAYARPQTGHRHHRPAPGSPTS